jgi:hypothetical protein
MNGRGSTLHVILACMLGAFACSSIAIFAGYHIGYGIVAGLIVGYLAYDFRSVLKAVPVAFAGFRDGVAEALRDFRSFVNSGHFAFMIPGALLASILVIYFSPDIVRIGASGDASGCALMATAIIFAAAATASGFHSFFAAVAALGYRRWEKKEPYDSEPVQLKLSGRYFR